MTYKNKEVFLALVRAGLWEKEVRISPFNIINYDEIYRLAQEQSVSGLVAAGFEHVSDTKIPQKVALTFAGDALKLEQRNTAMNYFISVIVEKMRGNGIYTILVKGQGIAQCYERPLWRACGDVDFLLSESNYIKAKEFLQPLSSSVDPERKHEKHLAMTIEAWEVELHGSLKTGLSSRIDKLIDSVQVDVFYNGNVRSWINGQTQVFLPSADNDIVFIFTHFLKHFYKEGLGLRQICDWCRLLWTFKDSLNQGLLETRLKKMGLTSEWKAFGAFAVEYLGMPADAMPLYSADVSWKKKADRILSFIMEVGNMGHNRDTSYFANKPYLARKFMSLRRRCGDMCRHACIFPLDSVRFFSSIVFNGLRSAVKGE